MFDFDLNWGGDLGLSSNNDLEILDGGTLTNQRLLRRIYTASPSYFWNPTYGVGLGGKLGSPADAAALEALIRGQILLEPNIASSPPATVTVDASPAGVVTAWITFTTADSGSSSTVTLTVNN